MNKYIRGMDESILNKITKLRYDNVKKSFKVPEVVTIGWDNILADPPFNDSDTTKKELLHVSELTKNLSSSEIDLVKMVDADPNLLYQKTLKKHNLEFPEEIFKKSWAIMYPVIENLKYKFNRPRPYQLAPLYNININIIETNSHKRPAYPSGHTAYAALGAYILSAKYPQYSSEFFSQVSTAGMARMLQGVHYPSDSEASMVISAAIWENIRYDLFPELQNF